MTKIDCFTKHLAVVIMIIVSKMYIFVSLTVIIKMGDIIGKEST